MIFLGQDLRQKFRPHQTGIKSEMVTMEGPNGGDNDLLELVPLGGKRKKKRKSGKRESR